MMSNDSSDRGADDSGSMAAADDSGQFSASDSGRLRAQASSDPGLGLEQGEQVADVIVTELLSTGGGVAAWRARRDDGTEVTVYNLLADAEDSARDRFLAAAGDMSKRTTDEPIEGILHVSSVDPIAGAFVSEFPAAITAVDVPAQDWTRDRQLTLMRSVIEAVDQLHQRGMVHGSIRPEMILLDAEGTPALANTRGVDIGSACRGNPAALEAHRAYAAPELRHGKSSSEESDVYALGRMMQFLLLGETPDEVDEGLPRLDSMKEAPEELVNIIRRATAMDPSHRYTHATELLEDFDRFTRGHKSLGIPHPDDGGRLPSIRPPATAAVRMRTAKPEPARKSQPPAAARERGTSPRVRSILFSAIGVLLVVGTTLIAYFFSSDHIALSIAMVLAAAPLTLALPRFGSRPKLFRGLAAAVIVAVLVAADPIGIAANREYKTAGLKAPKLEDRVAFLKERIKAGDKSFIGVDLATANLAGLDMGGLELDGSKLNGASCKGSNFIAASMINVDVTGADFSGASLTGAAPEFMTGWSETKCDATTTMPTNWLCVDGSPAKPEKKDEKKKKEKKKK